MKKSLKFVCLALLCGFSYQASAYETVTNVRGETIVFIDEFANNKGQEVVLSAMSLQGIQYKYGGNSPETGFDCSGFVKYVFHEAAKVNLPRTARGMSSVGQAVQKNQLQAGDLVFFNTLKKRYSHVGIYIGGQKFIHSPRSGRTVSIENMNVSYWKKRYNGAKRVN